MKQGILTLQIKTTAESWCLAAIDVSKWNVNVPSFNRIFISVCVGAAFLSELTFSVLEVNCNMWFTRKFPTSFWWFENERKLLQIPLQLHTDWSLTVIYLCVNLLWFAPLDSWKVRLEIKQDMDLSLHNPAAVKTVSSHVCAYIYIWKTQSHYLVCLFFTVFFIYQLK